MKQGRGVGGMSGAVDDDDFQVVPVESISEYKSHLCLVIVFRASHTTVFTLSENNWDVSLVSCRKKCLLYNHSLFLTALYILSVLLRQESQDPGCRRSRPGLSDCYIQEKSQRPGGQLFSQVCVVYHSGLLSAGLNCHNWLTLKNSHDILAKPLSIQNCTDRG